MDIDQNGSPVIVQKNAEVQPKGEAGNLAMEYELYPNPTDGLVNITFNNIKDVESFDISVIDINGRVLRRVSNNYASEGDIITLDLSDLAKGVYNLRINSSNGFSVKRVVLN